MFSLSLSVVVGRYVHAADPCLLLNECAAVAFGRVAAPGGGDASSSVPPPQAQEGAGGGKIGGMSVFRGGGSAAPLSLVALAGQ